MSPNAKTPLYYWGGIDGGGNPNFSITATPLIREITAPEFPFSAPTDYTVNITSQNGFAGTVTLGVLSLPQSSQSQFLPVEITGGAGSSTLKITVTGGTPSGSYTLIIFGSYGGVANSVPVQLIIKGRNNPPIVEFKGPGPVFVEGPIDPTPGSPVEE